MASALDDHIRCRNMVCIVCYNKGNRKILDSEVEYIQSYLIDGFSRENLDFPSAICDRCHCYLNKKMRGHETVLPLVEDYDPGRPKLLRDDASCGCKICKVAKSTINSSISKKKKRGRPPKVDGTPDDVGGKVEYIKICSKCFSRIGQGYPHDCSRRGKVSNIQNLLSDTPTTAQRFASRLISDSDTHVLQTLGSKPKPICSSGEGSRKRLFTVDDMSLAQQDLSLSNRQTKLLAEDLRKSSGSRLLFEPALMENIRKKNRQLHDMFEMKTCNFVTVNEASKSRENFQQHIVVCSDIDGLVERMIQERNIDEEHMLIRIGLDGGRGFMKICLSVFDLNAPQQQSDESTCKGKRLQKRFKNSGVKKVMVIAIVPEIQENYFNVKRLWLEAGIDRFSRRFTIATDLKLCNILLGLMSHSSTHPCCWCDIIKNNLSNKGVSRTIQSMMDLFWSYFEANADKKDAKNYGNVIHQNMLAGENIDPSTDVIAIVPPPELHLLIGPVNTLYDELQKVWPPCVEWAQRLYVVREDYHGGSFNGNDSRKLLKNISILEEISSSNPKVQRFVDAFKAFNDVVTSCYGVVLAPDYKQKISTFRQCYKSLKISVTPKVHAVFHHISEFCDLVKMGLSPYSEQTAESLHHDFTNVWNSFKVRDTNHPEYGERLLQATIMYNSQHL